MIPENKPEKEIVTEEVMRRLQGKPPLDHPILMFRIPRTPEGEITLKELGRGLNRVSYRMRIRYRGKSNGVRKADAKWYAVYVFPKIWSPNTGFSRVEP